MATKNGKPKSETALQPTANSERALAQYREQIDNIDAEEEGIAYGVALPRLHVGGGSALHLQDDAGETYKEIIGVVAVSRIGRAYWPTAFGTGEGNVAPECTSADGVVGTVGNCGICPKNQWPESGGRKDCTEMRRLVVLSDDKGAFLLTLKPGSMRAWDRYAARLRATGLRYYAVRTKFSVEVAQNKQNVKFTRVVPTVVGSLDDATLADVLGQYDSWAALLTQQRTVAEDVETEDAEVIEI